MWGMLAAVKSNKLVASW